MNIAPAGKWMRGMAVKLQNKCYSNTLPCTHCPKGGGVQPALVVQMVLVRSARECWRFRQ